jgi:hypothetical protein|tara:strand:- start:342 stop:1745 length:1404 start_codon:yes stop_codon:yes gene_type:complete
MASWKKIIVSGSAADLASLTLDTTLAVAEGGTGATALTDKSVLISQDSGTDTVNSLALTSNGSIVVGGSSGPAVEAASDVAGTGLTATTGDGTLVINVDAAQTQITSVGTLDAGAISSGFGNIDNGTSTLNTGNATVDNLTNASAVADSHITGSFTGSYAGDGSNLTGVALDIDGLSALGGTGIAQGDKLVFSDAGTEKSITFSNLEDAIFGNVGGDVTIAAGGTATLANNSVSQAQLDDDAVGADELAANAVVNASIASGAAIDMDKLDGDSLGTAITDFAQDDLVILSDTSDSGNLVKITTSNFEDAIFGNVSGEATIAAGGALTIAANTIGNNELKQDDDITLQSLTLTGNLVVNGTQTILNTANLVVEDKFILLNSGSANGDGGIIVQSGSAGEYSGSAFVWDQSTNRWGYQIDTELASTATTSAPEAYAPMYVLNANSGSALYAQKGNIKVNDDTGDIFIYS